MTTGGGHAPRADDTRPGDMPHERARTHRPRPLLLRLMTTLDRRTHNRRREDRRSQALTTLGWVGPTLTALVIVDAAARAVDYLREGAPTTESLAYLDVFGLHAWGRVFATTAAVLTVALLLANVARRIGPLVVAHGLAAGVYVAFTVAVLQGVARTDWTSVRSLAFPLIALALNVIRLITTVRAAPALGVRWWR